MYFNPLPRKEGDGVRKKATYVDYISIHSLVKRETLTVCTISLLGPISIHSLVKRETAILPYHSLKNSYFNPLPRKEGDDFSESGTNQSEHFNPLPRKEGDARY